MHFTLSKINYREDISSLNDRSEEHRGHCPLFVLPKQCVLHLAKFGSAPLTLSLTMGSRRTGRLLSRVLSHAVLGMQL